MKVKLELTVPKIQVKTAKVLVPGSNRGLAHGSSGVHADPDNESNVNRPSGSNGARSGRDVVLVKAASHRHGASRIQPWQVRQACTPIHWATPHRQAGALTTTSEAAPVPQETAGSQIQAARRRHTLRVSRRKDGTVPTQLWHSSEARQAKNQVSCKRESRTSTASTTARRPTRVSLPSSMSSRPKKRREEGRRRDTHAKRARRARLQPWRNKVRPTSSPT